MNVLAGTVDDRHLAERSRRLHAGPTKTGKRRTITVPRFLAQMLGEHIGRYPLAMDSCSPRRKAARCITTTSVAAHYGPRATTSGLPPGLRFHDLRHTCAALSIAAGRHLEEVKDYLGPLVDPRHERPLRAPVPGSSRRDGGRARRDVTANRESRGPFAARTRNRLGAHERESAAP